METPLAHLSAQLAKAVAEAAQHVVTVHARPRMPASGVVWTPGIAVTADHTIAREDEIHLTLPGGSRVEATLKSRDPATNLAVLQFSGEAAPVTPSGVEPSAGSLILAVGRNADTGPRAAFGILSSVAGPWRTWRGGHLDRMLRLDLLLHPSASGGMVIDAEGRFVGIATDGLSRTTPLAIPEAAVSRVVQELLERGRVTRAYLGVGVQPVTVSQGRGQILLAVEDGSAAERGGLLVGDVILAANGTPLSDPDALQGLIDSLLPGGELALRIVRGGENIERAVTLGERGAS